MLFPESASLMKEFPARIVFFSFLLAFSFAGNSASFGAEAGKANPPKWGTLKEKMRQDGEGLTEIKRPDGSRSIDLNGRFTHMSALVRDENGKLRPQCFSNFDAMDKALSGKSRVKQEAAKRNEVADK
jgi:hypothetical protein